MKYEYHELSNVYPMMEKPQISELGEDIKTNDLRVAIITYEGKILDGRNRYEACLLFGIEPKFREHKKENGDPLNLVISLNGPRRHLTPSQKAAVAANIATLRQGEHKGDSTSETRRSTDEAAKKVGASVPTTERARRVKREAPEKFKEIESGKKTVNKAIDELKKEKAPKPGREVWGPRDRKDCAAAFGKFIRLADKAPFWNEIKAGVEVIAKELRK